MLLQLMVSRFQYNQCYECGKKNVPTVEIGTLAPTYDEFSTIMEWNQYCEECLDDGFRSDTESMLKDIKKALKQLG